MTTTTETPLAGNFVRDMVARDVSEGKNGGLVITRFPPEPNGYLHIGHAKAICIDFGMAAQFGGRCHLRMDDTNPVKEEREYIDAIQDDIHWLGFDWGTHYYHASNYFGQLYDWAVLMIKAGKAYVCDLTSEQITEYRGTLTEPGRESPGRARSVAENLDLFDRMRKGEFPDGTRTLRARIDMTHPNVTLRDPVMYRILHAPHPHTGTTWCIYPMYDWAHGESDWLEGVTHSLCTTEYEIHRPLYDWFVDTLIELGVVPTGTANGGKPVTYRPRQTEFARLNLTYTVLSKRRLIELVKGGYVTGWDDPRMPTLCGLRRRGFTAESIRAFVTDVGVTKFDSVIDITRLENAVRNDLNARAPRRMGVLNPLKVTIENYPEDGEEWFDAVNNPEDASAGSRKVPFSRTLYIEREDFMEDPPRKFHRLAPGREVRLRYACYITCTGVVKDPASGEVVEIRCTFDPESRGGSTPDGRKVRGTIHWVSARHAFRAPVRLYDRLFAVEDVGGIDPSRDWKEFLNRDSLKTVTAFLEPVLGEAKPEDRFQLERLGYFCADRKESTPTAPVFNRIVSLKDSWAKIAKASED